MMNKILLLICLGVSHAGLIRAQSYEGRVDYQKTQQAAAMIQLPHSRDNVEDALKEYMAKKGAKSSEVKGFIVFRSVRLNNADTAFSDLYFMTGSKNRKEKDITVLSLLPVPKNQDIPALSPGDNSRIAAGRAFLDSLAPYIDAYGVEVRARDQENLLKKARKKMDGYLNEQTDLEKKIRRLEAAIDENKKDQVKEAADLNANINADDDTKKKNNKKIRKLMDDQGDLEKKLRKAQSDLDQNKIDQRQQQAEIEKQQEVLEGIKAKGAR